MGTYFRIYITDKSLANIRPIGVIVAGYLGGPLVGAIVGCISWLHRYSLGGFTLIKAYVAIEKARFSNRLEVKFLIDDKLLHMKFPILILQPIVENSIKHGILKK